MPQTSIAIIMVTMAGGGRKRQNGKSGWTAENDGGVEANRSFLPFPLCSAAIIVRPTMGDVHALLPATTFVACRIPSAAGVAWRKEGVGFSALLPAYTVPATL